jgi:hypothetical protein
MSGINISIIQKTDSVPDSPNEIVRPEITGAIAVNNKTSDANGLVSAELAVEASPTVEKDQEVRLFLNEIADTNPASYTFSAQDRTEDTTSLTISVKKVKSGDYLARIVVDGIQSLLSMTDGKYSDPKVII